MRAFIVITLVLMFFNTTYSQTEKENGKAKVYYLEARIAFEKKEYNQSLRYLNAVEKVLKKSNPRVLSLKCKIYAILNKSTELNKNLNLFKTMEANASYELKNDLYTFLKQKGY